MGISKMDPRSMQEATQLNSEIETLTGEVLPGAVHHDSLAKKIHGVFSRSLKRSFDAVEHPHHAKKAAKKRSKKHIKHAKKAQKKAIRKAKKAAKHASVKKAIKKAKKKAEKKLKKK